jgi:hypothetical protein
LVDSGTKKSPGVPGPEDPLLASQITATGPGSEVNKVKKLISYIFGSFPNFIPY